MKKVNATEMRNIEGGWNRCAICGQNVSGSWWKKYRHCLKHACNCLPWWDIMGLAFGIWN